MPKSGPTGINFTAPKGWRSTYSEPMVGRLYAAGNGVYISLDNGDTWRLTDLQNS